MLKSILKKEIIKQFLRFCLVGLESTILNYLCFTILLYFLLVNYTISFIIGFIVGVLFGFVFNKLWAFESEKNPYKEIGPYFLVYLFSLIIGILLIRFLVSRIGIAPILANIPVLFITTIVNFFGTKLLAFKNKKW